MLLLVRVSLVVYNVNLCADIHMVQYAVRDLTWNSAFREQNSTVAQSEAICARCFICRYCHRHRVHCAVQFEVCMNRIKFNLVKHEHCSQYCLCFCLTSPFAPVCLFFLCYSFGLLLSPFNFLILSVFVCVCHKR